jgi:hypothetical protein
MTGGDQALDPGPLPREFLLDFPMIGGHPTQEIGTGLFGVDAADVLLVPPGPSVGSFVVPEVEVPPAIEIADPDTAADFHFSYL